MSRPVPGESTFLWTLGGRAELRLEPSELLAGTFLSCAHSWHMTEKPMPKSGRGSFAETVMGKGVWVLSHSVTLSPGYFQGSESGWRCGLPLVEQAFLQQPLHTAFLEP